MDYINRQEEQDPPYSLSGSHTSLWIVYPYHTTQVVLHLPGLQKSLADQLSRAFSKKSQWSLKDPVLYKIFCRCGVQWYTYLWHATTTTTNVRSLALEWVIVQALSEAFFVSWTPELLAPHWAHGCLLPLPSINEDSHGGGGGSSSNNNNSSNYI